MNTKRLTNLIIVAGIVGFGIKIVHDLFPVEGTTEVVSSTMNSQADCPIIRDTIKQPMEMEPIELLAEDGVSEKHSGATSDDSTEDLESRFLNAVDPQDLKTIKAAIIARLDSGDAATLDWITQALDGSEPKLQRHLIEVLGRTEASEATEALLQFAKEADKEKGDPKISALRVIAEVRHLRKASEQSRSAASAILEDYLSSGSDDGETLYAVANGISKLGRPEGISRLIELLETKPEASAIVSDALTGARSAAAISVMENRLRQDPELSDSVSRIIGSALAAIGTPKATKALLILASNTQHQEAKQTLLSWLSQINDWRSIQLLINGQDEYQFVDPQLALELEELGTRIDNNSLAPLPLLSDFPQIPEGPPLLAQSSPVEHAAEAPPGPPSHAYGSPF